MFNLDDSAKQMACILFKRFLKGFASALCGQLVVLTSNGEITSHIASVMIVSGIAGGILAVEKYLGYEVPNIPSV